MSQVAQATGKEHYLAAIERTLAAEGPEWLRALRRQGAERFEALEFPHRKMEAWRVTNIAPIIRTPFEPGAAGAPAELSAADIAPFSYAGHGWQELVLVDGQFVQGLSQLDDSGPRPLVNNLAAAIEADDQVVANAINRYAGQNGNIFDALSTALIEDGAVVHIPKGQAADTPIHILHIVTGAAEGRALHPRLLIVMEPGSQARVVESFVCVGEPGAYFVNVVEEIELGEGARLDRYKVLHEGSQGYHLATTQVHQEKDSNLTSFTMSLGARIGRNALSTVLAGPGAHCSANGLYLCEGQQLIDNPVSIEHAAPHCTSWIGYKGVLDGRSHGVYSGRVFVARAAQKTDSNQLNQNLLLSDTATIDTKPLLEIFADDVKCTHGATIGQPPEEIIFYFRTRGISEAWARAMLTYGFADEVVEKIDVEPLRERLQNYVFDKYSPK